MSPSNSNKRMKFDSSSSYLVDLTDDYAREVVDISNDDGDGDDDRKPPATDKKITHPNTNTTTNTNVTKRPNTSNDLAIALALSGSDDHGDKEKNVGTTAAAAIHNDANPKPLSAGARHAAKEQQQQHEIEILDDDDDNDDDGIMAAYENEDDQKSLMAAAAATMIEISNTNTAKEIEILDDDDDDSGTPQRRKRGRPFSCPICLEDDIDSFKGYTLEQCNHRFCQPCLRHLIRAKINDPNSGGGVASTSSSSSSMLSIVCPDVKCKHCVTDNDVQFILRNNRALYTKYTETANARLLESELAVSSAATPTPTTATAATTTNTTSTATKLTRRCPAERCNFIFVVERTPLDDPELENLREGVSFDCPMCHESFCLFCPANHRNVGPAHYGRSCAARLEQLQREEKERKLLEQWRLENSQADTRFNQLLQDELEKGISKPCPNCNRTITKNGGCDHMHCSQCNHDFNWSQAGKTTTTPHQHALRSRRR